MTRRQVLHVAAAAGVLVLAALVGAAFRVDSVTPDPIRAGTGSGADPLIVIGTGGIAPTDLSPKDTPTLWGLLRDGSSGALNVTAVHADTCPVDGWLTLSAGGRAGQPDRPGTTLPPCAPIPPVESGTVSGWDELAAAALARPFGSRPGTLAQELASHRECVSAVGAGAALGAALPRGGVTRYQPYAADTLRAGLAGCSTALVDVGTVRDPGDVTPGEEVTPSAARAAQVRAVDDRVAEVVTAAPSGADIIVASLADAGRTAGLRLVLAAGPRFGPGSLYSPSTRQSGLVQLDDVTATVLAHAGVPVPPEVAGSVLRRVPAPSNSEELAERRHGQLADLELASQAVRPVVYPFFVVLGLMELLAVLGLAVAWRLDLGGPGRREDARRWVGAGLVVGASVPAATFLANVLPWWRFPWPTVGLLVAVAAFTAVVAGAALLGPWRRAPMGPPFVVAAATFLVLAADVMTGSGLQLSSLLGSQPIVGGRYYGMGNVAFGLFAAAALLMAVTVSARLLRLGRPRWAAAAVALVGVTALVVDGAPAWGSDVGGPPALLPGLAVLVLAILRVRLTWLRVLAIAAATALTVVVVAVLAWLRPAESRSHLGRFVQTALDGGAADVVERKLAQNLDTLLGGTRLALLVPVAMALLILMLARPSSRLAAPLRRLDDRIPTLRAGLVGLTVTLTIGLLLNDTGVAIPPAAFSVAVPLLVAAGLRVAEEQAPDAPARGRHRGTAALGGPGRPGRRR